MRPYSKMSEVASIIYNLYILLVFFILYAFNNLKHQNKKLHLCINKKMTCYE